MQDLNDLYLFAAVVSHEGFSAAARALQIPKSRLSKRVAHLEAELGIRLLERSTRTVRVTDVGQAFYEECKTVLASVSAAEALVGERLSEPRGIVRVACPPALAKRVLAAVLPGFTARYPDIRVLIHTLNRPVDLVEERFDVALRASSQLRDPDLMVRVLARGADILVAAPDLPDLAAITEPALISQLPTLSAFGRDGVQTWRLIGPTDQTEDISIEPRIVCDDFDVILAAACAGQGVALLPEFVCQAALRSGALTRVLPHWATPEVVVHIVFPSRRGLPRAVRALIDYIAAEAPGIL